MLEMAWYIAIQNYDNPVSQHGTAVSGSLRKVYDVK